MKKFTATILLTISSSVAATTPLDFPSVDSQHASHATMLRNTNPWTSRSLVSSTFSCLADTLELNTNIVLQNATETWMSILDSALDFASDCVVGFDMTTCYIDPSSIIDKIAPICEDLGGTMEIISIAQTCPNDDVGRYPMSKTVLGFPGCLAPSCDSIDDILGISDPSIILDEIFDNDEISDSRCTRDMNSWEETEKSMHCSEKQYAKFLSGMNGGNVQTRTCSWLSKQSVDTKEVICRNLSPFNEYNSAMEACPKTCCSCMQDSKAEFLRKTKMVDGTKTAITKSCSLLESLGVEKKLKICKKKKGYKGIRPARAECPQLCGTCPTIPSLPIIA